MSSTIPIVIEPGQQIQKDPDSSIVLRFDWTRFLHSLGETTPQVATSDWIISGSDALLTKDNESIVTGAKQTQLRIKAGTVGVTYTLTNRVTTNEAPPQIDDRSITVLVAEQ